MKRIGVSLISSWVLANELFAQAPRPASVGPDTLATSSPTFFTALDEQLGLRLVAAKGPGEVLVIESVHRPSEN